MTTSNPSFLIKPVEVAHDRPLVRRFLWQSVLRRVALLTLTFALCVALPLLLLWLYHGAPPITPARVAMPAALMLLWLFLPLSGMAEARSYLQTLRDAGSALTPELISSRPRLSVDSPLDPLTTFDVCAEVLSGVGTGAALGYPGPAAFSYQPFQGRIVLGPRHPLWLWRSTEVLVSGEPGSPITIAIRRRFGLDFFLTPQGEAARSVQVIAGQLRAELQRRHQLRQMEQRQRELERAALSAKLAALQAQVEPHFLFNTLANLKYLIRTDAASAQQMLDHLVGYLQNALPDMRSVSSTLERELALASDYLAIMQIRMGSRLRFRIEADAAARALPFPPAMLISLVENAIKHGLEGATRDGDLLIAAAIDGDQLRLAVRDNGAGLSDLPGQGLGLANIDQRLRLLYGERASLAVRALEATEGGGVEAALSIPLTAGASA